MLPTADETRSVPRRRLARQARQADRRAARAAGVRRLLDVQVVRLAAGQRRAAAAGGGEGVLPLDSQARGRRTRRGTSSSASVVTATGSTLENGATNFYRAASRPGRHGRERQRRRSWACRSTARSATTIRSKNGRTTSTTAWPTCSPACGPKAGAAIPQRRRHAHVCTSPEGRTDAAAHRQAATARAARRRAARRSTTRAIAAKCSPTGSPRPRIRTSAARSPIASGRISSASAWSNRSTICGSRTPPATKRCWPPRRKHLVDHKYDLKSLMRAILQIETYQRSQPAAARERRRTTFLLALLSAAADGRSAARCDLAGDRRADAVQRDATTSTAARTRPISTRPARGRCSCTIRRSFRISSKPSAATSGRSPASASGPTSRPWCRCCTSPTATCQQQAGRTRRAASPSAGRENRRRDDRRGVPPALLAFPTESEKAAVYARCLQATPEGDAARRLKICIGAS